METFGFKRELNGTVTERLPQVVGFETVEQKRAIAIELINSQLPDKSKINLQNTHLGLNLYEILFDQITTLSNTIKKGCSGCGCTASSLLIVQSFFASINLYKRDEDLIDKNICGASKIIELFNLSSFSLDLNLDINSSFTNLVYQRMIPMNNQKTIICHKNKIEVKEEGKKALTIYPKWQDIDTSALYSLDNDIEKAGKTISNNCNQVYLVFPKNESFKKHVKILHSGIKENETIKLIPYSFSFTERTIKKSA